MLEARKQGRPDDSDQMLANARCEYSRGTASLSPFCPSLNLVFPSPSFLSVFNNRRDAQSDAQALASARAAASGAPVPTTHRNQRGGPSSSSAAAGSSGQKRAGDRREMATDDVVMQRFKKRQMNGMKR